MPVVVLNLPIFKHSVYISELFCSAGHAENQILFTLYFYSYCVCICSASRGLMITIRLFWCCRKSTNIKYSHCTHPQGLLPNNRGQKIKEKRQKVEIQHWWENVFNLFFFFICINFICMFKYFILLPKRLKSHVSENARQAETQQKRIFFKKKSEFPTFSSNITKIKL